MHYENNFFIFSFVPSSMNIKNIILDQREEWALLNERTSFIQREYLTPWKDLPES